MEAPPNVTQRPQSDDSATLEEYVNIPRYLDVETVTNRLYYASKAFIAKAVVHFKCDTPDTLHITCRELINRKSSTRAYILCAMLKKETS